MLESVVHKIKDSYEEKKQQEIVNIRAEIEKDFSDFLDREMHDLLSQKCHIGNTAIMLPLSTYCDRKIMNDPI